MKNFTQSASRVYLGLLVKIIICTIWLLCIASAAMSRVPVLGQSPAPQTVCAGSNPTFTIGTVTGTSGTVTIQWQVSVNGGGSYSPITNGANYSGVNTSTLTVLNVSTAFNGNMYRCVVTDATGNSTTVGALLTVNATPAVSSATRSTTVCEGATGAGLQVFNDASLSYQWQVSINNGTTWNNATAGDGYSGANTYDLTYPTATLGMSGYIYRYIATNITTGCSATSIALDTLYVLSKPVFGNSGNLTPVSATICPGASTSFTATATGSAAIAYQWQLKPVASPTWTDLANDAVYSGAQTNTLQLTGFTPFSGNTYQLRLVASYPSTLGCAMATNLGALSVRTMPSIAVQPRDTIVCANSPAGFRVTAAGSVTLQYLWETDNGTNGGTWSTVTGATTNTLSLGAVTTALNGYRYRVTVTNSFCGGPITSLGRTLTVRRSGTWLGAKDTAWQEPLNWCGGVPDNTIDVLVPNWPTKMPLISAGTGTAFYKSIEIENAARLTISGGVIDNMTGPFNIQGTVAYIATGNQEIFPANHGSLEINGSGNKFLSNNVDVSNNLVLGGSAKLVTRTNILTMRTGSNPIVTSAFTDPATSWIVTGNGSAGAGNTGLGRLRIEQVDAADGAVLFPVGPTPAAYNPIQLTNAGTVDHFAIAVNDQMIPGGVFGSGVVRTWLVSESVNGGSNVTLSLKWQGGEEQSSFDRTQTQIIRSNGTQIVEASLRGPANGANPYARADGSFATLTQFSVTSGAVALPLELKSFTAQKSGNAAAGLTWNITASTTAKHFNVQRATDGVHFITIGQVNAEAGKTSYNYTDNLPGSGTVFYRLQMTGQQNDIAYSAIQSLLFNKTNLVQLRPSATNGSTTYVYLQAMHESIVTIYVTDITGRVHARRMLPVNKGEHLLPLWIGGLNKGVYNVHVKDSKGNANVLTLVKQ
ncbi:hypothetical protein FAM09_24405 [Niastella caeni]|uniref:Ig-like domain-containing protein n=1 Tax=Niastella caeni TaxID=2569763 RepID=A0A4S8HG86_9BACT|nr:immunoglobulin domain-containing protein [Niastella caeni]THU34168.1 hypothetical protein FAM09_24405 [Niastella caeni]